MEYGAMVLREDNPSLYYAQAAAQAKDAAVPCFKVPMGMECTGFCKYNHVSRELFAKASKDNVIKYLEFDKFQSPLSTLVEFFQRQKDDKLWSALKLKLDTKHGGDDRPAQSSAVVTRSRGAPNHSPGLAYLGRDGVRYQLSDGPCSAVVEKETDILELDGSG